MMGHEWVQFARLRVGLTQKELAEHLGLVTRTIQRWENPRHRLTLVELAMVSRATGFRCLITIDPVKGIRLKLHRAS